MAFELICSRCAKRHDSLSYRLACDRCGGLLEIEYDAAPAVGSRGPAGARGLRRFASTLPIKDPANFVTLGEGDTPVVPLEGIGSELGLDRLLAKLEYISPTGAFKDRGNAVQVTVLKELGIKAAIDIAGGNAGHSFASYCARAGIKFVGFAYEDPQHPKLQAIAHTGAEIHRVDGDRKACVAAARMFSEESGTLNMVYARNAYFIEGQKTIAYEIAEQLDVMPDHIVVPVGNGSLLLGIWRGFKELIKAGRVKTMPRIHAAQASAFQPLVAALQGRDWSASPGAGSVAVGITNAAPPRLEMLVAACRDSGGEATGVDDESILRWHRRLAELDGILIEPTSATVLAATELLIGQGVIEKHDLVLLPLTGFGIKEPINFPNLVSSAPSIPRYGE